MSNKKIPMRQSVGCHEMKAKRDMIRVIKTAPTEEGETEIILGAYICPNRECLAMAIKNKGLERSFKMPIPKDVYETLTKEMEQLETR